MQGGPGAEAALALSPQPAGARWAGRRAMRKSPPGAGAGAGEQRTWVGAAPGEGAAAGVGAPAAPRRVAGHREEVARAIRGEEEDRLGGEDAGAAVEPGLREVGQRDVRVGLAEDEDVAVPCREAGAAASAAAVH